MIIRIQKNVHDSSAHQKVATKNGAQNRRQQFHSQRSTSVSESRPRLTRAMSAPIRPNDAHSQAQTKKVFRRKKITPLEQPEPFHFQFGHQQQQHSPPLPQPNRQKFFVEKRDERPSTCRPKIKVSKVPAQTRARSAVSGCDIVTLVSLLSPGGSDSEKEEHSIKGDVSSTERSPSLRKIGKSGSHNQLILDIVHISHHFLNFSVISRRRRCRRSPRTKHHRFVISQYSTCITRPSGSENPNESTPNRSTGLNILDERKEVII